MNHHIEEILNIILPPIENLPGAGDLGIAKEMFRMSNEHDRYSGVIKNSIELINKIYQPEITEKIKILETNEPKLFSLLLEIIYIAYYSNVDVQKRIKWRPGPLQPQGFSIQKWDEKVLNQIKKRKEFWKKI
mgnify:FL=1